MGVQDWRRVTVEKEKVVDEVEKDVPDDLSEVWTEMPHRRRISRLALTVDIGHLHSHIPETIFSKACFRLERKICQHDVLLRISRPPWETYGLILSRSNLLSNIETGKTFR